jgi:BirA family biotin operon repressor/biotin-[acetyl-CoA-carboxylase] ligase
MSLLLFAPAELRRPALLVAWAAVSVCEVIGELTGLSATIKWPNDVLVHGKKVCGILTEQRNSPGAPGLATVVGLGLNVLQPAEAFADAGLPDAGSLLSLSGKGFDAEDVACRVIGQLDTDYDRLLQGDIDSLEARWKERLALCGRPVCVETTGDVVEGRLLTLTFANIEIAHDGGGVTRLTPEAVRHVHAR